MAVQRAQDKTQQMQARASAMDELMDSGVLTDYTSNQDDIDRQLNQLTSGSQVDAQLTALKQQMNLPAPEAQPQLTDSASSAESAQEAQS